MIETFVLENVSCQANFTEISSTRNPVDFSLVENICVDLKVDPSQEENAGLKDPVTGTWYARDHAGFDGETEQRSGWKFSIESRVHDSYDELRDWFRANYDKVVQHCSGRAPPTVEGARPSSRDSPGFTLLNGRISTYDRGATSRYPSMPTHPAIRSIASDGSHISALSNRSVRWAADLTQEQSASGCSMDDKID